MSQFRLAELLRGRISLPQIRHSPETCVFSTKSTVVDIPTALMSLIYVPTLPRDEGDDDD
jgi:hypothetical protein